MREKSKFINGRLMICPRCKKYHDILQYKRLMVIEEYAEECSPIYKCSSCSWMFSLADNLIFEVLSGRLAVVPAESDS